MSSEDKKVPEKVCAWCGVIQIPVHNVIEKSGGKVNEYRCSACGKIVGAYLEEAGEFLSRIKAYPN